MSIPYLQHSVWPLREFIASAIVQLLQNFGQNKITVISNQHLNFVDSKCRAFSQGHKNQSIQIATHLETFNSPNEYLQELQVFVSKLLLHLFHNLKLWIIFVLFFLMNSNGQIMFGFSLSSANLKLSNVVVKLMLSVMLYFFIQHTPK